MISRVASSSAWRKPSAARSAATGSSPAIVSRPSQAILGLTGEERELYSRSFEMLRRRGQRRKWKDIEERRKGGAELQGRAPSGPST